MNKARALLDFLAQQTAAEHSWVDDGDNTELCIHHGETRPTK